MGKNEKETITNKNLQKELLKKDSDFRNFIRNTEKASNASDIYQTNQKIILRISFVNFGMRQY